FVDIWEGFVDENGAFTFTGPDMNGQNVRLRASDGINLTQAAKRKIAFYLERPLNRFLGPAASPDIEELDEHTPEQIPLIGIAPDNIRRTAPISLANSHLEADGGELLGAASSPPPARRPRPMTSAQHGRA